MVNTWPPGLIPILLCMNSLELFLIVMHDPTWAHVATMWTMDSPCSGPNQPSRTAVIVVAL